MFFVFQARTARRLLPELTPDKEKENTSQITSTGFGIDSSAPMKKKPHCTKQTRKSRNIHKRHVGMSHKSQETPNRKYLVDQLSKANLKTKRAKKELVLVKKTIKEMRKLPNMLKEFKPFLSNQSYSILCTEVLQGHKKPRGRRYSFELKVFCLGLWKSGPAAYKLYAKTHAFPSRSTLQKFLVQLHFEPGFNFSTTALLMESAKELNEMDSTICLLWDETRVKPHLYYDKAKDKIVGYQDLGGGRRTREFATEVLVFMISSLSHNIKKFKQPISYYLCSDSMHGQQLAPLIKSNLLVSRAIGFNDVATACDQNSTNINALKELGATAECPFIILQGKVVVFTFDPPHLLKCVRNLLLKHNIHIGDQVVTLEYFTEVYKTDQRNFPRFCWKLKDVHLAPKGKNRMKVKLAAQLFSRTVGSLMKLMLDFEHGGFRAETTKTVEFTFNMDSWFDSVNNRPGKEKPGKLHIQNNFQVIVVCIDNNFKNA